MPFLLYHIPRRLARFRRCFGKQCAKFCHLQTKSFICPYPFCTLNPLRHAIYSASPLFVSCHIGLNIIRTITGIKIRQLTKIITSHPFSQIIQTGTIRVSRSNAESAGARQSTAPVPRSSGDFSMAPKVRTMRLSGFAVFLISRGCSFPFSSKMTSISFASRSR